MKPNFRPRIERLEDRLVMDASLHLKALMPTPPVETVLVGSNSIHAGDPAKYSAIVFVGGWGASSYQYAFAGTYADSARPDDFAVDAKPSHASDDVIVDGRIITAQDDWSV